MICLGPSAVSARAQVGSVGLKEPSIPVESLDLGDAPDAGEFSGLGSPLSLQKSLFVRQEEVAGYFPNAGVKVSLPQFQPKLSFRVEVADTFPELAAVILTLFLMFR